MADNVREIVRISRDDWLTKGKELFGKDPRQWKFVCPNCGNIQSGQEFIDVGIKDASGRVAFSCIGRWLGDCKGEIGNKISPCNYTNGGLFDFSTVRVVDQDGGEHSVFEFYIGPKPENKGELF